MPALLAALDVDYRPAHAVAACALFATWPAAEPHALHVTSLPAAAGYTPGAFYERELPALLAVLAEVSEPLATVIVDGYAWLGPERPGLGVHLYRALEERVPVVGVAKNPFRGAPAVPILRGASRKPLFITAAGCDPARAAGDVARMDGPHRIPTLLRAVDRAAREASVP